MVDRTKSPKGILAVVFTALIVSFAVFNYFIQKETEQTPTSAAPPVVHEPAVNIQPLTASESPKPTVSSEVIRKTRVESGSEFVQNIFLRGEEEIARQKVFSEDRYEQTGTIPDGLVKFFNEYDGSYGEEYYLDNKKHGIAKTYHPAGKLKAEEQYKEGKLLAAKEYYTNGNLCFEIDYTNAPKDVKGKEIGNGKLYYLNGVLKYEWSQNKDQPGYKKSYNPDGTLRSEMYFDNKGNPINAPVPRT